MNIKTDVEVVINGKQYTLSGYESSEYMQKIANHINKKLTEFKMQEGYSRLDIDMKNILLAINLSDDYYKAQKAIEDIRLENEEMGKEVFDMKHELISAKTKIEELEEELKKIKQEKKEAEHQIIRLETKLNKDVPEKQTTRTSTKR